jgi:hypothetical protein
MGNSICIFCRNVKLWVIKKTTTAPYQTATILSELKANAFVFEINQVYNVKTVG